MKPTVKQLIWCALAEQHEGGQVEDELVTLKNVSHTHGETGRNAARIS